MTRRQVGPLVVMVVAVALLAVYLGRWALIDQDLIGGSDFSATYVGASLWREGHHADLYSGRLQDARHAEVNRPNPASPLPFVNPPAAALLAAPLALLSLHSAYRVWSLGQLVLLAAAVALATRASPWPHSCRSLDRAACALAALAGVATVQFLLIGQWDGVGALGLAAAYASWRRARMAWGGAVLALSASLAKPHLALGLAALLMGWRQRRVLTGAAGGAAAGAALSLLAVGPAGALGFVQAVAADANRWPLRSLAGFTGLFGSWMGDSAPARWLALAGTCGALAACAVLGTSLRRRPDLLEPVLGGAVALSLVASPHLLLHDLVLLAPALVWTYAWAATRDAVFPTSTLRRDVAGLWVVLNLAAALDLGRSLPAPPGRLVPWALLAAGVAAWLTSRAARRSRAPFERDVTDRAPFERDVTESKDTAPMVVP